MLESSSATIRTWEPSAVLPIELHERSLALLAEARGRTPVTVPGTVTGV
ncbi:MAG: hypothetical protein H0X39_07000 [Actinobacteria bacterium]|nr:hypothetical protein [Actinomycetota bacterium]